MFTETEELPSATSVRRHDWNWTHIALYSSASDSDCLVKEYYFFYTQPISTSQELFREFQRPFSSGLIFDPGQPASLVDGIIYTDLKLHLTVEAQLQVSCCLKVFLSWSAFREDLEE